MVETCKRFGLYASFKKTFTQIFNNPELASESSLFEVAGHTIENVTRFKLLGHTVDSGSTTAFVNARIASATGQYHKFRHVFSDRTINKFSKIRFLEAYVRSRLTYAVAATVPTEATLGSLSACWYRFLRRLHPFGFARKSLPDGSAGTAFTMTNDALNSYFSTPPIRDYMHVQFLNYIAHIVRRDASHPTKKALFIESKKRSSLAVWQKVTYLLHLDKNDAIKRMKTRVAVLFQNPKQSKANFAFGLF